MTSDKGSMAGFFKRFRRTAAIILLAAGACAVAPLGVARVEAFQDDGTTSFLNPFPDGEVYRMIVVGDWFADGVLEGLVEGFGTDVRLNIERKVVRFSGIMRRDFESKAATFETDLGAQQANIIVVMTGEADRVSLRNDEGRRVPIASPEWVTEYKKRVDQLMRALKRKNAGVYWVGLPTLARVDANEQAQVMNESVRERAYLNGFKYIDATAGFTDESGGYSAYGPDLEGTIRVLRAKDGVHFTAAGNRKLAHFVEKEIRRDLNQARRSRDVPLLGGEDEQSLINPDNTIKTPAPSSPVAEGAAKAGEAGATPLIKAENDTPEPAAKARSVTGDQSADNGKIALKIVGANGKEEASDIEIVRPAIPASVIALVARRESSGQQGDLLVDQIGGGVTLMTSVSPSGQQARGSLSPTQAPYFRLLVKGERLEPKPGRADDIAWPPPGNDTSDATGSVKPPNG